MASIAVQKPTTAGLVVARQAAVAGGDTLPNDGETYLEAENPTGGAITVTINRDKLCEFGGTHNLNVAVAAGTVVSIGPFPRESFSNPLAISYSGAGLNVRGHR